MNAFGQARAFAAVALRILVRDPSALFFMLFLPVAVIVIVGAAYGAQGKLALGIVQEGTGDPLAGSLAAQLEDELEATDGVDLESYDDADAMRRAIRRFELSGGVVVPEGLEAALADGSGTVDLIVLPSGSDSFAARTALQGALDLVGAQAAAARVVAESADADFDDALTTARSLELPSAVEVVVVDVEDVPDDLSRFALTAAQNLVLFTFINSLTAAGLIVIVRRDRVLQRALSAPVSVSTVVAGLTGGWFVLALTQSLLIVVIGAVFFGVGWGDPVAASILIVLFALVGCGAGVAVGAIARDADRVGAVTPVVGIILGALGGCLMPLEIFPDAMLAVARFTPHYWAMTAWQNLVFDRGGVADIAGSLAVLAVFAGALIALATWLLYRDLSGAGPRPEPETADK